jgi:hypothetical protein
MKVIYNYAAGPEFIDTLRALRTTGLDVQYLGSHSLHLDRSYFNNTPYYPGPGAINPRRPNPRFTVIRYIQNDEISNYEALSVTVTQRLRYGFQLRGSYTWAHTLDAGSDSNGGGGTPMNPYNWRADYGNANWDIRHRLVLSFIYDVPFFAVQNPFLKAAFTKWQANGIITLQSGLPFNVSTGTDTANTASGGVYRPNLVHTATADCGRDHMIACIDASAFTVNDLYPINPTNFAYGNAGRNLLRYDGVESVDFSVFKNFPITEKMRFQFRFETFGLTNHTNFGAPGSTINTSSFGNITSASGARNIQLGAKLFF